MSGFSTDSALSDILEFPRMKLLASDVTQLRRAGRFSPELVLSADGTGAKPRWSIDEYPKERLKYSRMRLKHLPLDATQEQVTTWLRGLGISVNRLSMYANNDGSKNGSGEFIADSIEVAQQIDAKYKGKMPRWNGNEVLIELAHTHVKSGNGSTAPTFSFDDAPDPTNTDELHQVHYRFLEECKQRSLQDVWSLLVVHCESTSPGGPFRYIITIEPHKKLPGVKKLVMMRSPLKSQKKVALRLVELKAARYLYHIVYPNLPHPFPLQDMDQTEPASQEEMTDLLLRLHRQTEAKRLQCIFREVTPHNMNVYVDTPGTLLAVIGGQRSWTKPETNEMKSVLKTRSSEEQEAFATMAKKRKELLSERGFSDSARPTRIAPYFEVPAKKQKDDDDTDSEGEESSDEMQPDIEEGDVEEEALLESLEIGIPAMRLQVGVMDSPESMRVLWQTTTQLSVSFEELTPRVNILWSRHNIQYSFKNVLRNVSDVMWIESDLGTTQLPPPAPSAPVSQPNESNTLDGASETTKDTDSNLSEPISAATSAEIEPPKTEKSPEKPARLRPVTVPATFLDLFIPIDSAPRLTQQEHFQTRRVGALDFTPDAILGQATLIRVHFDLTLFTQQQLVDLLTMCKGLAEFGLLRSRFRTSPTNFFPPPRPNQVYFRLDIDHSIKSRTLVLTEKETDHEPPVRLVEVDHWVKWKLVCLVTHNRIRLSQITAKVVELLLQYDNTVCFRILEKLEGRGGRILSLEERLAHELRGHRKSPIHLKGQHFQLKENFDLVAHVSISPMEVRCEGPLPELSNRLLRGYQPLKERFLRLSFHSSYTGGLTGASMRNIGKMAVRKRIGGILLNGLFIEALRYIYERPDAMYRISPHSLPPESPLHPDSNVEVPEEHKPKDYSNFSKWEFLVASSSQLRTQKAWMYSPPLVAPRGFNLPIKVPSIRKWLGDFDHIYNVAMYAARLGQGLSSTYGCFEVDPSWIRHVPEITTPDGQYMFSDGCASISPSIAERAARALNLQFVPSAFQIRLAGIKGMVSVDPRLAPDDVICVRPSMSKFQAPQQLVFEVVTWTRPLRAHLNKQIIQILSALGLPDQNFIDVQRDAFENIAAGTFPRSFDSEEDRTRCIDDLAKSWVNRMKKGSLESRAVAMLRSGFDPHSEPYLKSIMTSLGLRALQDIHSMARIPIKNGRYAIGIVDEFAVLKPGQVYFRMSKSASTPASTLSGSSLDEATHVHTGLLCISRSPCLHPGDARFVEAVDVPGLAHLVDVLVFPQVGERPIPDECSGGDLDGDQYLILWGDEFIPPRRDTPAFKHETSTGASKASKDDNEVYSHELVDFFVNYIFDDKLSSIADAHTYWADKSEDGVFNEKCLRLAEAHGIAVDAPKTGKVVQPMAELSISTWPDFMNVNKSAVYLSQKVLGILFRRSSEEFATLANHSKWDSTAITFDEDMRYEGHEAFIEEAKRARDLYFEQLVTTMQLFKLPDEASAITGEPLYRFRSERRNWESKKEGFEFASTDLRTRFRQLFGIEPKSKDDVINTSSDEVAPESDSTEKETNKTEQSEVSTPSNLEQDSEPEWSEDQLRLASAWYVVTYDPAHKPSHDLALFSFPWLVDELLCAIKSKAVSKRKLSLQSSGTLAKISDVVEEEDPSSQTSPQDLVSEPTTEAQEITALQNASQDCFESEKLVESALTPEGTSPAEEKENNELPDSEPNSIDLVGQFHQNSSTITLNAE